MPSVLDMIESKQGHRERQISSICYFYFRIVLAKLVKTTMMTRPVTAPSSGAIRTRLAELMTSNADTADHDFHYPRTFTHPSNDLALPPMYDLEAHLVDDLVAAEALDELFRRRHREVFGQRARVVAGVRGQSQRTRHAPVSM